MNVAAPSPFFRKVNLASETQFQNRREEWAAKQKFVEQNLPVLEALSEARSVRVYLRTEAEAGAFVQEAVKLKLAQQAGLGLEAVDA